MKNKKPRGYRREDAEENQTVWEEDWIRFEDKIYEYNEDVLTFLVMGIDKRGKVSDNPDEVSGGQADALFLVVLNPDSKEISIIAINRDTMTEILMYGYGEAGNDKVITAQIAAQHGFGDGKEKSCELTCDAVSGLFYDLPIHGYISVNMDAVGALNDAVGGVEVVVLEDLTKRKKSWKEGAVVKLEGEDAFWYVKWRDTTVYESNRGRLARQKQYLTAFVKQALEETKKDITVPLTLYNKMSKYVVTDITVEEIAYLAGELPGYHFTDTSIYILEELRRWGKNMKSFTRTRKH